MQRKGLNLETWVDFLGRFGGDEDLELAKLFPSVQKLSVEVGQFDDFVVGDCSEALLARSDSEQSKRLQNFAARPTKNTLLFFTYFPAFSPNIMI